MGKVLRFAHTQRTLEMRIARECSRAEQAVMDHAKWLYQWSAGFADPAPLTDEERQMLEDGVWEP